MKDPRILHLTLKKKWFDMILSGEKKEEYREFKDYWLKRLSNFFEAGPIDYKFKQYDYIIFTNGYAKHAPTMKVECKGVGEGLPRSEWSDNAQGSHIILLLGKVVATNHIQAP